MNTFGGEQDAVAFATQEPGGLQEGRGHEAGPQGWSSVAFSQELGRCSALGLQKC